MTLSDVHLVLFLSRATPLARWDRLGLFSREVALYTCLRPHLRHISIVTVGGQEERSFQGRLGDITILPNLRGWTPNAYSLMAPWIHRESLVHASVYKTNQFDGAWSAVVAGRLYRKPVIVRGGYLWAEFHDLKHGHKLKSVAMHALQKGALRGATRITVTSDDAKAMVEKRQGIVAERIQVIPNYVDTTAFRPLPDVSRIAGRVLYIGRLHPRKNLGALIAALAGLEGASLRVIGSGEQGTELARLCERYQVKATFVGTLPHALLPAEINSAEMLVLPSLFEGHPKALIEAMSCGAAVVGGDVPGIRGVIEHERTGLLCQPTVGGFRSAVERLRSDAALRRRLGCAARSAVEKRFSLDRVVELELEAIERALESGR